MGEIVYLQRRDDSATAASPAVEISWQDVSQLADLMDQVIAQTVMASLQVTHSIRNIGSCLDLVEDRIDRVDDPAERRRLRYQNAAIRAALGAASTKLTNSMGGLGQQARRD